MNMVDLKQRLRKDRPMATITMSMPEDVIVDLKRVASLLDYSGYQPLIRAYIGQGLRSDLARLDEAPITRLLENLKAYGVPEDTLSKALANLSTIS